MKTGSINKKWFGVCALVLIGFLIGLQGCATAPRQTDYFGNDTELTPDQKDSSLLWWEQTGFNMKFSVDGVTRCQIFDAVLKGCIKSNGLC
ncbi:MAG: hypothetical protein JRE28_09400 [Deltaproteobacteria bacterium]|nr:hypothetical protein [Deltaproteobacteria bacterium]